VTVRVVAVYGRGFGFGPVVASRDLVAGHAGSGLAAAVLLRTDGAAATGRALAALAAAHPGVALGGGGGRAMTGGATGLGGVPPSLWLNLAVLAVLLGYLLLGVANKLVATTGQRRTEFAALRLIGTTPGQVRAMVRREAAFVVGTALLAGLLVSAVPLVLLAIGFLHRPWPAGPLWLVPAVALVVAAIGLLAAELPTRRALRTHPTTVLADRG
jgi:putative ABC transport system permease protein